MRSGSRATRETHLAHQAMRELRLAYEDEGEFVAHVNGVLRACRTLALGFTREWLRRPATGLRTKPTSTPHEIACVAGGWPQGWSQQ